MKPDTCVDCGASAPPAETSYTAIGHGWRINARTAEGDTVLEWRCSPCWKAARASKASRESPRATGPATRSR